MPNQPAGAWCLVVPVKRLALAKTRLSDVAGDLRAELALALALDTVTAALRCDAVRAVVVVTDEPDAASALQDAGALVTPDAPDSGLNPALAHGADVAVSRHPGTAVGALSADLPGLVPAELAAALAAAPPTGAAFVRDADGSGTTTLLARHRADFVPAFGPGSARAHLAAGAVELYGDAFPSLRRDVDTPADLAEVVVGGAGVRTAEVARRLAALNCR